MINRALEFALKVVNGDIKKGDTEIACCQRFIDDLENSELAVYNFYFDLEEAEKAIDVANTLTIAEGEEIKPLKTRGFQNFIIGNLHGWRRKDNNALRFREAYIQMARQNGKSFLAGTECNYWSTFTNYIRGRIFTAATKQDQANIVWEEVVAFIESDKNLSELYKITKHRYTVKSLVTGTVIKSVSRDTKSLDGFRTILSVVDEYHAHQTNQMYSLLYKGQTKVSTALMLAITTAGFNINGPCHQQYEMCKKIVNGLVTKESQFVYIAEPNEDSDIFDPETWAMANPLSMWNEDDTLNEETISVLREMAITAKEKQGEDMLDFMTKTLNIWVTYAGDKLLDDKKLKECRSNKTLEDMRGKDCYLGIDLSSGGDLTSISLVFPLENQKSFIHTHSFMPKTRLEEHEKTDLAPYRHWVKKGLLTLTTGGGGIKTDYKFITQYLKELIKDYDINVIDCGYDPHNAGAYISDLEFLNCDLTEITQSAKSLNDPTVDFKLSVKALEVEFNKENELLVWSAANAITDANSFGEIKVDKKQRGRIDPIDAIIDAWKLYFLKKDSIKYNANDDYDDWEEMMRRFRK